MTWTTRTAAPAAVLGVAALALSACGGTDSGSTVGPVEVGTETVPGSATTDDAGDGTTSSTTDDSTTDDSTTPTAGDTGTAEAAGLPPRPERDRCVDVPEATDGVYTVYEAGTATVTVADGRLTLVEVQAADGWTSRVDDEDADEVQIDFRPDGQGSQDVLDLEVEVDNGRVEVRICNDDD